MDEMILLKKAKQGKLRDLIKMMNKKKMEDYDDEDSKDLASKTKKFEEVMFEYEDPNGKMTAESKGGRKEKLKKSDMSDHEGPECDYDDEDEEYDEVKEYMQSGKRTSPQLDFKLSDRGEDKGHLRLPKGLGLPAAATAYECGA